MGVVANNGNASNVDPSSGPYRSSSKASLASPDTESLGTSFTAYKQRWYLLSVLFVLNLSNAMAWLAFAPVAYKAAQFYNGTSLDTINFLSVVFMIVGIPCGIVATWLLDTIGLRFSVILSAWLNCIGCVIRLVSAIEGVATSAMIPVLFLGQIIAALAQPFVVFAPTKLSALWFRDNERAIANTLATMANPLGIMLANILSPQLLQTSNRDDMQLMLGVQCIPAILAMLMATLGWWTSKPPTPPSASALTESESFLVGVKAIAKNFQYYLLALVVGGGIALFSVLTTLLSQILCPWGYDDAYVGLACGTAMIGAGFFGSAIAGVIVDKTKRFIEVTKTCYVIAVAALVVFAVFQNHSGEFVLIAFMCGIFGFFGIPIYPIGNELAVETTYPVGEATSSGIVFMVGQVQGIILVLVLQSIGQPLDKSNLPNNKCNSANLGDLPVTDMSIPVYVMVGYAGLICIIYLLFFRTEYKRLKAEKEETWGKDEMAYTEGSPVLASDRL